MNEQSGTSRLTRRSINWICEDSTSKTPLVEETSTRVLTSNTILLPAVAPMTHEQNEKLGDLHADKGKPWVSLFVGNIVASNGMAFTYITHKLVNGNIIVKLDEK